MAMADMVVAALLREARSSVRNLPQDDSSSSSHHSSNRTCVLATESAPAPETASLAVVETTGTAERLQDTMARTVAMVVRRRLLAVIMLSPLVAAMTDTARRDDRDHEIEAATAAAMEAEVITAVTAATPTAAIPLKVLLRHLVVAEVIASSRTFVVVAVAAATKTTTEAEIRTTKAAAVEATDEIARRQRTAAMIIMIEDMVARLVGAAAAMTIAQAATTLTIGAKDLSIPVTCICDIERWKWTICIGCCWISPTRRQEDGVTKRQWNRSLCPSSSLSDYSWY